LPTHRNGHLQACKTSANKPCPRPYTPRIHGFNRSWLAEKSGRLVANFLYLFSWFPVIGFDACA
jgi:hypothetical protein